MNYQKNDGKQQQNLTAENIFVWSDLGWTKLRRVIRHVNTKNIYGILTYTGYVEVTSDHSLLTETGDIIKPSNVKVGYTLLHKYTPTMFSIDVMKNDKLLNKYIKKYKKALNKGYMIRAEDQIHLALAYNILSEYGYNICINIDSRRKSKFGLKKTNYKKINPNKVTKIINLGIKNDYIYDLETENHHFSAGIGRLIVHNTDSISSINLTKRT